ncbi:MAG: histidine kinase N-terminal 7TM domain-containing protein, partial [Candidatus Omnitrophica bacterium]|nr:histidine kinase N-terminal 7TM domain-containing protein [Candidatus Omnitrophota bacterium]
MNLYSFFLVCFLFGVVLIAVLSLIKRRDLVSELFAIFSVSVSGWAFCAALWMSQKYNPETILFLIRSSHVFSAFIPITWVHFIAQFIEKKIDGRFYVLNYGFAIILMLFSFSPLYVKGMHSILSFKYYTSAGFLFFLHTAVFALLVPYGFYLLFCAYRKAKDQRKAQIKYLLFGTFFGFLGGSCPFLPVYGVAIPMELLIFLPLFPVFTGIALIRYGLFDMEELAQAAHRDKLTAIGVLAASINHEVRNPLFIIKGLAESCLDRQREGIFPTDKRALESANDALKRSMEQADRAMDIIKRLSLFAKAGIEGEMKFEAVPVAEVLEDILPLVRYELVANNIALTRDIPKNLPGVYADRRYLEE